MVGLCLEIVHIGTCTRIILVINQVLVQENGENVVDNSQGT